MSSYSSNGGLGGIDGALKHHYKTTGTTQNGLAYLIKTLPPSSSASLSATCTILFGHANGFNKEVFLPVWEELEKRWRAYPGTRPPLTLVSLDFTGHGDSRSVVGPDCYDWRKGAGRDVLELSLIHI